MRSTKFELLLIGAGGHCRSCIDVIEQEGRFRIAGIFEMPAIISPLAYLSKHARIGQGTIIMHHTLVNAGAKVGDNCIINTKALIEHDAVIEDHGSLRGSDPMPLQEKKESSATRCARQ